LIFRGTIVEKTKFILKEIKLCQNLPPLKQLRRHVTVLRKKKKKTANVSLRSACNKAKTRQPNHFIHMASTH
jgi:hypothetical protein